MVNTSSDEGGAALWFGQGCGVCCVGAWFGSGLKAKASGKWWFKTHFHMRAVTVFKQSKGEVVGGFPLW